jgi:hypothetical protein
MRTEGARDAKGPNGPAGLGASRHRGLPKSVIPAFALFELRRASRKSAQSQGVPRAVFEGLLCIAPGGLTFQASFLIGEDAYPPLWANAAQWRAAGAPGPCSLGRRVLAPHLRR